MRGATTRMPFLPVTWDVSSAGRQPILAYAVGDLRLPVSTAVERRASRRSEHLYPKVLDSPLQGVNRVRFPTEEVVN